MRIQFSLIVLLSILGFSEGVSTAGASAGRANGEAGESPDSNIVTTSTAELVDFYLHFYDNEEVGQNFDLLEAVEKELVDRGADSVQALLKYPYCLDRYPYRSLSLDLIEAIGPDAKDAIPELAKVLAESGTPVMASREVELLVGFGTESIPVLIEHYNGDDLSAVWAVSFPLGRLGAEVVTHLKPSLLSNNEKRREITMDVLSLIGPDAADLIPDLRRLLETESYRNQLRAARTLANLGDTQVGLSLLFAEVDRWSGRLTVHDDPPAESFWAIVELERCQVPDAQLVIEKLLETLEHSNLQRRRMAIVALKPHGRNARVQGVLGEILQRQDRHEEHAMIAGMFGSWGAEFQLDQEEWVIELLEQAAKAADQERAYDIRSDLGRIKTRRWIQAARDSQNLAK